MPEDSESSVQGIRFWPGSKEDNRSWRLCCLMAATTSYSNHQFTLLPFYVFYSMFGFQRIGDLAWAAGGLQAKGFYLVAQQVKQH